MAPTILLVEDDHTLRFLAAEALSLLNANVIECPSADKALDLLQSTAGVNLVLTDIQMPGHLDGLGLARKIWSTWPDLPVILTSGKVVIEDAEVPSNSAFIPKPWSLDELQNVVLTKLPVLLDT